MRNRILMAVILILPPALFVYFWLQPGALKEPPAGENNHPPGADGKPGPLEGTNLAPAIVK